jgi:hypothetical protein
VERGSDQHDKLTLREAMRDFSEAFGGENFALQNSKNPAL